MRTDQLDLFTDAGAERPAAAIICFPLDRDVARIRRVARLYLSKSTDKAKAAYWRSGVCNRIFATMTRNKIPDDEARRQLEAFRLAVGIEMDRLATGHNHQPRHGGDAA